MGEITAGIVALPLALAFGVSSGLGPLFFGSTSEFQSLAKQIPQTATISIIRMDKMQYIDQSGLFTMEDVLLNLNKNNIKVLLVNIQEQPKYLLERIKIIPNLIPKEHLFNSFEDCLEWIKKDVN